jgi:hypothetical protein
MADVKITYTELMNKGAKATDAASIVKAKAILANVRKYIIKAVTSDN